MDHESTGGVGLDHVGMGPIVPASCKAAGRSAGGLCRAQFADIGLDIGRRPEPAVRENRQHRHRAAEIIGHEHESPRRMNAQIRRPRAAGRNRAQRRELSVRAINGEGTRRALLHVARVIRLVSRIETSARGVHSQTARAAVHFMDARGRERAGSAINAKQMNPAAVPRGQIDLRREHIAQRRAERADIGDKRTGAISRSSRHQTVREVAAGAKRDSSLQKRAP